LRTFARADKYGIVLNIMFNTSIPYLICSIVSFVPAIVLHEMAHGFAAYKLGDPTAKRAGRLSFNPLAHIDPFGTVIMPLLLMAMNMPVFGYAKPVPYNPSYFKDPRKGDLIVGLAGPGANLLQAILAAVVAWAVYLLCPVAQLVVENEVFYYFYLMFLPMYALINLYLMFFNLLPIPPLDGSSIFAFFMPVKWLPKYYKVQQYAFPIFMILVILVPYVCNVNPFGVYLNFTAGNVANLLFPFKIS
jgi:Zn-dependent protease